MMAPELVALAIMEGAKVMMALGELLTSSERLSSDEVRAEVTRIFSDVQIDEAIERRMFERMRERAAQKDDADKAS